MLVLHSEKPFVEALVLAVAGPRTQIVSLRLEHVASFHPQISTMTMAQARFKFSSGVDIVCRVSQQPVPTADRGCVQARCRGFISSWHSTQCPGWGLVVSGRPSIPGGTSN